MTAKTAPSPSPFTKNAPAMSEGPMARGDARWKTLAPRKTSPPFPPQRPPQCMSTRWRCEAGKSPGGAGDHLPASECQSHQRRQTYLHRNALGHVRAKTDAAGVKIESAIYKTFGEQTEAVCHATRPRNQGLDRRTLRRRRRPAIFERAVLLSDTGHVHPAELV